VSYLLDTNVVSVMRRADRLPLKTSVAIASLPESDCFISVVTLMEIRRGVLLKARNDPAQAIVLQRWLERIKITFGAARTLDVTSDIALGCARLHVPNPRPSNDALIAATALVHDLTVVTRNVADFKDIDGLVIMNPWA
jgi:predicted nucleic acid-binding protein